MQPQVSCSLQSPAAARRAANGATVRRPEAQKLMQLPCVLRKTLTTLMITAPFLMNYQLLSTPL
jgi:hypothetical protein